MSDNKPVFWSSEKLLSLSAILISVCTLFVFLYQTNLIRQQQYKSVYPYLSIGNYGSQTKNFRYVLENKGIGPAVVKSIKVKHKDRPEFEDIATFVIKELSVVDSITYFYSNISPGRLISPDEKIEIIGNNDGKFSTSEIIYDIINDDDLDIEIIYESIYEESWKITNASNYPIKE